MLINKNKIRKLQVFLSLQIIIGLAVCGGLLLGKEPQAISVSPASWKVLGDSGFPGASTGRIESLGDDQREIRLNYDLKATRLWPWPEIDIFTEFNKPKKLTNHNGVQLNIKGRTGEEVYFYFLVRDNNIYKPKPVLHRIVLSEEYRKVYLDLLGFEIAKDWTPRNPGFSPIIEWERVEAAGLHKKGRDGESGSISLLGIEFLKEAPNYSTGFKLTRGLPTEHFFIEAGGRPVKRLQARALIHEPDFAETKKISPYLYGANLGVWLDFPDRQKTRQLGLKILRQGGPFMDRYNWRSSKYTFPGSEKPLLMRNVDNLIQYCRDVGAEPLIQLNALGYGPDEKDKDRFSKCMNPDDAADLIRYLNKEKGYKVKFFEIGNEPFIWHNVHSDVRKNPCSAEEYFKIFKEIAVAIKKAQAEIDPAFKIKIFGPAISTSWLGWRSLSEQDSTINPVEYFLKECRRYELNEKENPEGLRILDVLSFHLFPDFKNPGTGKVETDIADILNSTRVWWDRDYPNRYDRSLPQGAVAEVIPKFKSWIERYYPGTELAVTEFNIDSESMVEYKPVIKVLYLADLYGIMAECGLDYAVQFCLNSSDHHAALIDDTDNITPLYYPLQLYSEYFKGTLLDTEIIQAEALKVHACKNENGVVVMVINTGNRPLYTELILKRKDKEALILFHDFAALSITCVRIPTDNRGNTAECWEYGEDQINGSVGHSPNL